MLDALFCVFSDIYFKLGGEMDIRRFPAWPAITIAIFGIFLHGYINLIKADGGLNAFTLGLFAFSALPYTICILVALVGKRRPLPGFVGAVGPLLSDLRLYHSVFVAPNSSTAAISLLFGPLVNLAVLLPLGMLIGSGITWWCGRRSAP